MRITKTKMTEKDIQDFIREQIIRGDAVDGVPNIKSPNDIFMIEGVNQTAIRKTEVAVWLNQPEIAIYGSDETMKANYIRNKTLIDLDCIPETVVSDVITVYNTCEINKRSKLLKYFVKFKLGNMVLIGEDGMPFRFRNVEDYIEYFVKIRMKSRLTAASPRNCFNA